MKTTHALLATLPRARVIVADPPWQFGDALPGDKRGADKHYETLDPSEIMRFPLPPFEDPTMLCLWRVAAMQQEALDVIKAWGFSIKSEIVWRKRTKDGEGDAMGMGHYVRGSHEVCLIATRGGRFHVKDKSVRSIFETHVIEAPRGEHSAKPDEFYALVERLAGDGPFVELFARKPRAGWHTIGEQLPGGYAGPQGEAYGEAYASVHTLDGQTHTEADSPQKAGVSASGNSDHDRDAKIAGKVTQELASSPTSSVSIVTEPEGEDIPRVNGIRTIGEFQAALVKAGAAVTFVELTGWSSADREAADRFLQGKGSPPKVVELAMAKACHACGEKQPHGVGDHTGKGPFCRPGAEVRAQVAGEPVDAPAIEEATEAAANDAAPAKGKRGGRKPKDKPNGVNAAPALTAPASDPFAPLVGWEAARGRAVEGKDPVFEEAFFS